MRKVTKRIKQAFENQKSLKVNNTETDGNSVFLHGHEIIKRDKSGLILFNLCGYETTVTRERIKHICSIDVHQHKGEQYYKDQKIFDINAWHVVS